MALTADLKDELARIDVSKNAVRVAELSTILRFSGGLHLISGKVAVEVELDTAQLARRVRKDLAELFGIDSELAVISASGIRKSSRYQVRVIKQGDVLARQTGLLDSRGRPVRGLPANLVSGSIPEAQAVWRGAFLAHGSLTDPGRSAALEITAPGNEAAMALVGVARRLGVTAKAREVRGVYRVVVREGEAIATMLTQMGAHTQVLRWEEMRLRREVRLPTVWPTLTTPICAVLRRRPWLPGPELNAPLRSWAQRFRSTCFMPVNCDSNTSRPVSTNWGTWPNQP